MWIIAFLSCFGFQWPSWIKLWKLYVHVECVCERNLDISMISKYCTCLLKIYRILSLVDVIKKIKLGEANWGPYSFCSLKRKNGQVDFDIICNKDDLVMMKIDWFKFLEFSRFCGTPFHLLK